MLWARTSGAGAGMCLVLGDLGLQVGQLGDLVPGRFGIVGSALARQRRLAMRAPPGDKQHGLGDPLRRQQLFQVRGMSRLASRLASRGFLASRLGRLGLLVRRGRLGQILVLELARQIHDEPCLVLEARFQLGDARFQFGDTSIALAASLTRRSIHAAMLAT